MAELKKPELPHTLQIRISQRIREALQEGMTETEKSASEFTRDAIMEKVARMRREQYAS